MTKIRGVFFDLGWTLEKPHSGDWMFTDYFWMCMPAGLKPLYRTAQWLEAEDKAADAAFRDPGKILTMEQEEALFRVFFRAFTERIGFPADAETCDRMAREHVWNFANYVWLPDMETTVRRLHRDGCRVGIISDTWPSSHPYLKFAGVEDLFDTITFSCDLGVMKPDPLMYEDALRQMQLPGSECVFVDDLPKNLLKAQEYGIHPVQSTANPLCVPDPCFPHVQGPAEVPAVLAALNAEISQK